MQARSLSIRGMHSCALVASIVLVGCQTRANPEHFDVRDLVVTEAKLTCDLILVGSPSQVMTRYEARTSAGTVEVTVFVQPRAHARMDDSFRRLEIPVPPSIERVVLTDGQQIREIWHRPGTFETACRVLETSPLGTRLEEIERRLSLPPPTKTYLGSGTYHDRIFRYEREDGLTLLIGLRQQLIYCTDSEFLYLGHHTVGMGDKVWSRWATENDVFESRSHDGSRAATQPAPRVAAPARAVEDFDQITIVCFFVWGGDPEPVLVSPIADNDLAAVQEWPMDPQSPGLDRRGNWNEFVETSGVSPVTTTETRMSNGVNEYEAIDSDGPGPQPPVNLGHDANGNVALDPTARNLGDGEGGVPDPSGQTYEYDEENRLTAVRRAWDNALLLEIDYDALGRRVRTAEYLAAGDPCGGSPAVTRHVYAGAETLEEHLSCDGGANYDLAREFIWGDRFPEPVAMVTHGSAGGFGGPSVPPGQSVYHYLLDVLDNVVALTDAAGQAVERYTYDPYGKTVIEETNPATGLPTARLEASAFGNPFAWTGQRYDAGVRLYHFLFRGYSPHLGRWLQRDPIGYTEGFNLYEYVTSSPLRWLDLLGLERVISIHSNVTGGDKTGGHAWIEVRDTQTGERHSYGLWPDEHPLTEDNGSGNDIRKDLERDRGDDSVSRERELTPEEEKKLEEKVKENKT